MNRSSLRFAAGVVLGLVVGVGLGSVRQVRASQATEKADGKAKKADEQKIVPVEPAVPQFIGRVKPDDFSVSLPVTQDAPAFVTTHTGTGMALNVYRGECVAINNKGGVAIVRFLETPKSCVEVVRIAQSGKQRTTKLFY